MEDLGPDGSIVFCMACIAFGIYLAWRLMHWLKDLPDWRNAEKQISEGKRYQWERFWEILDGVVARLRGDRE